MFKKRLKELRLEKNITQEELADFLNVSKSTISLYENGVREPDLKLLVSIADYFNVSTDYLLGRIESDYLNDKDLLKFIDERIKFYNKNKD